MSRQGPRGLVRSDRRLLVLLVAALMAAALTGCKAKKSLPEQAAPTRRTATAEAVTAVGPASGATRLAKAQQLPSAGPFTVKLTGTAETNLAAWPDACLLMSGDQARAIVPGRYPIVVRGSLSPVHPFGVGKLVRPNRCEWLFGTNGSRLILDITGEEPPTIGLAVFNEMVKRAKARKQPVYGSLSAGTKCYFDGSGLSCVHADWRFTVYGNVVHPDGSQDGSSTELQERWLVPAASLVGPLLRS